MNDIIAFDKILTVIEILLIMICVFLMHILNCSEQNIGKDALATQMYEMTILKKSRT